MCVICVSPAGVPQPDEKTIRLMFENNPDMAGYMVARKKSVEIHKGYVDVNDLLTDLHSEAFTSEDVVVYHFRISTQGYSINMSQPFPVTRNDVLLKRLDVSADMGVAHNGIISLTSNGNTEYSDTALYIRDYIAPRIQAGQTLTRGFVNTVENEAGGRLAFLHKSGRVVLTGEWIYKGGLYYSNDTFRRKSWRANYTATNNYKFSFKR